MRGPQIFLFSKTGLGLVISLICFMSLSLWITQYSSCKISTHKGPAETDLTINFILPMQQDDLKSKISILPEIPTTKISYKLRWKNRSTAVLTLKQGGLPYGQLLTVKINRAQTKLPFISKSFQTKFRSPVPVSLFSNQDLHDICTKGPVPISFNTPVTPEDIKEFIKLPAPGKVEPVKINYQGKIYSDHSRWQYVPFHPLENNTSYEIIITPGLRSKSGAELDAEKKITFDTAPPISVLSTNPADQGVGISLYKKIEVTFDQDIIKGSMKITDLKTKKILTGAAEISGKKILFKPANCFLPGRKYRVNLNVTAANNESLEDYCFSFNTSKMEDTYWLDVNVGETHSVIVYKGDEIIRLMPGSGGRPETPTPLGLFYTQDRGHSFWSPRFGEGATYWVRLVGQVLIHSVPRDDKWEIKKDEHDKLGLPASHGCIRLSEEDAKWVYQNIPRGTMVIIHL